MSLSNPGAATLGAAAPAPAAAFSLTRGGFTHSLLSRFGLVAETPRQVIDRILALVLLTWVPMAILAVVQGVAWGPAVRVPFLCDLSVYARFLIAVPLFVLAGPVVDRRLAMAVADLESGGIVPAAGRPGFEAALTRLAKWRDSHLPEILLLGFSFGLSWISTHVPAARVVTNWTILGDGPGSRTSLAATWLHLAAMPLCMFLMMQWLWRFLVWSGFLWAVSRLNLEPIPTHPDRAGGLMNLGEAHTAFGIVLAAFAVIIAARAAVMAHYGGASLDAARGPLVAFVILGFLLAFGPLLLFTPMLVRARRRGLLEYGQLATSYVRSFDRKWVRGAGSAGEELLGSGDIQSLADMGNSFEVLRTMKPVPIEVRHLIAVALWMVIPMLPMIATVVPLHTMLERLLALITATR